MEQVASRKSKGKFDGFLGYFSRFNFSDEEKYDVKAIIFALRGFLGSEYPAQFFKWPPENELEGEKTLKSIENMMSNEDSQLKFTDLRKRELINYSHRRFVTTNKGDVIVIEGTQDGRVYFRTFDLVKGWEGADEEIDVFLNVNKPKLLHVHVLRSDDVPFGWKWFWSLLQLNSKLFYTAVICSLIIGLLSLAQPFYFQIVLDKFLSYPNYESLYAVTIGAVIAFLFLHAFEYLKNENVNFLSKKVDAHIVKRVSDKFLKLSLRHIKRYQVGVLNKHVNQTAQIRQFFSHNLTGVVFDIISLVIIIPVLFFLSAKLFIAVAIFCIALASILGFSLKHYRSCLDDLYMSEARRESFIVETIQCISMIKSVNMERSRLLNWHSRASDSIEKDYTLNRFDANIGLALQACQNLLTLIIVFIGVIEIYNGNLTVGTLVAFNMLVGKVTQPTIKLASLVHHVQKVNLSIEMLSNVMSGEVEASDGRTTNIDGSVEVANLSLILPESNKMVLNDVSFSIKPGQFVGIVGSSGAGKSVLATILQGINRNYDGLVKYGNMELRSITPGELRRQIGVLPQNAPVIKDTIVNNVVAGRRHDSALVMSALDFAHATEFIDKLQEGINTEVDESGGNLSGGQVQRIGLARAVYEKPKLLMLDEATSALDAEAEVAIVRNLMRLKGKCTVLFITHRLSNLVHADNIIVLDEGRLVEQGTHQALLKNKSPRYQSLWQSQSI
ncbi:MAG: peptidase domain-containing ABC transporter [Alteromonadales bacterium]|nr:peptidase domain-containing ABC transporter [Alteromonadales bacterium]